MLRILKTSINGQKNLFLYLKEIKPYWISVVATAKSDELAKCLPNGWVVGIDSSTQIIQLVQNTFQNRDYPNLSYEVMDARKLIFQSEFIRIFSNATLHWIIDQKAVLKGGQRSLKTCGRLIFQMAGKGNAQAVLGILDDLLVEEPLKEFFECFAFPYEFFNAEEYSTFLVDACLKPFRVELFLGTWNMLAKGFNRLDKNTWLPYIERLPIEKRDNYVKEIVTRYIKTI